MKTIPASHLDHGLTEAQVKHIKTRYANHDSFFIETFELPKALGTVPCNLHGPAVGEAPIPETAVVYAVREGRKCATRVYRDAVAPVQTRLVTIIAGPEGDEPCVLYTAYGGPCAPREPGDPDIKSWEELEKSRAFWAEHALGIW